MDFFFFRGLLFLKNAPLSGPEQVLRSEPAASFLAGHKVSLSNICVDGSSSYLFPPAQ